MAMQPSASSVPAEPSERTLASLIVEATRARCVTLDEHYELTAFVVVRGTVLDAQTIIVELIDRGTDQGDKRWSASAYDELHDRTIGLIIGPSADVAVAGIAWSTL